jgi:hypothetical protein
MSQFQPFDIFTTYFLNPPTYAEEGNAYRILIGK